MDTTALTLSFSLAEMVEIPVGAYCEYRGVRYTAYQPANIVEKSLREYDYTLTMRTSDYILTLYKMRCLYADESLYATLTDGRLTFSLTATPLEHLQMIVNNLNDRLGAGTWSVGTIGSDIADATEKVVTYDYLNLLEALRQIASTFDTEYSIDGTTISLGRIEYNRSTPFTIAYGRGNGVLGGLSRSNSSDTLPVERLYIQGGDRNIDPSVYGSKRLHFPAGQVIQYDGYHFYGQTGFDAARARTYRVSDDGMSITRADRPLTTGAEEAFDATETYPRYIGRVSHVDVRDVSKNFVDIYDNSNSFPSNLRTMGIAGQTATIVFQTGQLAGREFDLAGETGTDNIFVEHDATLGYKLEIVPAEIDGVMMPGGDVPDDADASFTLNPAFMPAVGDEYVIFGISLPQSYLCDNVHQTGAEWDALRAAVCWLYNHEEQSLTVRLSFDEQFLRSQWAAVNPYLAIGQHFMLQDTLVFGGKLLRVTTLTQRLNNPYKIDATLSNAIVKTGLATRFDGLRGRSSRVSEYDAIRAQATNVRVGRALTQEDIRINPEECLLQVGNNNYGIATPSMNETAYNAMVSSFGQVNRAINHIITDDETNSPTITLPILSEQS